MSDTHHKAPRFRCGKNCAGTGRSGGAAGCFCAGCARQQILFSAGEPVVQLSAVRLCAAGAAGSRDKI